MRCISCKNTLRQKKSIFNFGLHLSLSIALIFSLYIYKSYTERGKKTGVGVTCNLSISIKKLKIFFSHFQKAKILKTTKK